LATSAKHTNVLPNIYFHSAKCYMLLKCEEVYLKAFVHFLDSMDVGRGSRDFSPSGCWKL